MQAYASDDGVFIRSMASRGHAGGLAATSTVAATVLDAAGFDIVLLETVGTGQSEVEVAAAADTTVVLEAPEMGDEVQAIKAGLLEVADIVVVNKGDRPGAQRTAAQLRAMLVPTVARKDADPARPAPKRPEVLVTTALTGEGVPALLAALEQHRAAGGDGGVVAVAARPRGGPGPGGPRGAAVGAPHAPPIGRRRPRRRSPPSPTTSSTRTRPPTGCSRTRESRRDARRHAARRSSPARSSCCRRPRLAFFTAGGMVLPASSPYALDVLGADAVGAGVAVGAFALASLAMRPVVGWASDRFGRRPLLVGGALLTVVALLLHLAASTLPAFIAVRGRVRHRRGVLLRRGARRGQRPRAAGPPRRGAQPRLARRCTSGSPSGRRWARSP